MKTPTEVLDRTVDIMRKKHGVILDGDKFNVCNFGSSYLYRCDPFVIVCGNYFEPDLQLVNVVLYDGDICTDTWHISYDEIGV